jgi:hypothetical protein
MPSEGDYPTQGGAWTDKLAVSAYPTSNGRRQVMQRVRRCSDLPGPTDTIASRR